MLLALLLDDLILDLNVAVIVAYIFVGGFELALSITLVNVESIQQIRDANHCKQTYSNVSMDLLARPFSSDIGNS